MRQFFFASRVEKNEKHDELGYLSFMVPRPGPLSNFRCRYTSLIGQDVENKGRRDYQSTSLAAAAVAHGS